MNNTASIQVMIFEGVWRTITTTVNDPQYYMPVARRANTTYPGKRIRIIDDSNRLLDML